MSEKFCENKSCKFGMDFPIPGEKEQDRRQVFPTYEWPEYQRFPVKIKGKDLMVCYKCALHTGDVKERV